MKNVCFSVPITQRLVPEEEFQMRCARCQKFAQEVHSPGVPAYTVWNDADTRYHGHLFSTAPMVERGGDARGEDDSFEGDDF